MNINLHLEKQEHAEVDVEMLSIPRKDGVCSLIKAKKLSEKNEQPYHISTTWKIFWDFKVGSHMHKRLQGIFSQRSTRGFHCWLPL